MEYERLYLNRLPSTVKKSIESRKKLAIKAIFEDDIINELQRQEMLFINISSRKSVLNVNSIKIELCDTSKEVINDIRKKIECRINEILNFYDL